MEEKNKQSFGERGALRRTLGAAMLIIATIMALISGFGFYDSDSEFIWPIVTAGAALLGVGVYKDVGMKRYENQYKD